MLPKQYRLNRKEVSQVHRKGKRYNFGKIGFKCLRNRLPYSRFAVTVPVAVYKRATDRNRIRRAVYSEAAKLSIKGQDCLIGVFRPLENEKEEISRIFKQVTL